MNSELELLYDLVIKNNTLLADIPKDKKLEKYKSKQSGLTLLGYSVVHNKPELYKILLNRNESDIYDITSNKDSILHIVYRLKLTAFLSEKEYEDLFNRFDFNHKNIFGNTVLHTLSSNDIKNFLTLINFNKVTKEHLNIQNIIQQTCLHCLLYQPQPLPQETMIQCLEVCIKKGTDIFIKNDEGKTIYDIAKNNYHLRKVETFLQPYFEKKEDKITVTDSEIELLDHVCYNNKTAVVIFIDPNYNFVTIVLNNPESDNEMIQLNVDKSKLTKITKKDVYDDGDFIYDLKMLKTGLIIMNNKKELFIVQADLISPLNQFHKKFSLYLSDLKFPFQHFFWIAKL